MANHRVLTDSNLANSTVNHRVSTVSNPDNNTVSKLDSMDNNLNKGNMASSRSRSRDSMVNNRVNMGSNPVNLTGNNDPLYPPTLLLEGMANPVVRASMVSLDNTVSNSPDKGNTANRGSMASNRDNSSMASNPVNRSMASSQVNTVNNQGNTVLLVVRQQEEWMGDISLRYWRSVYKIKNFKRSTLLNP